MKFNDNPVIQKRLLNIQEAAHFLGISVRTIYNQIGRKAKKKFPVRAKRIGRRILFNIRELESYADSL